MFRPEVLHEDILFVLSYWPVSKGKDCPEAHKQNFFFENAHNNMDLNIRKCPAAIVTKFRETVIQPSMGFISWLHSKLHVIKHNVL